VSFIEEIGKGNVLEILSTNGGIHSNAFNTSYTNFWEPKVFIDPKTGLLSEPVTISIKFNKFIKMVKFSMGIGLSGGDLVSTLASPRDWEVYTSSTCFQEIPECIPDCEQPDPDNPEDPEAKILVDFAPVWEKVLTVKDRGIFELPTFNKSLCESPLSMTTSLVRSAGAGFLYNNFNINVPVKTINRVKIVITKVNAAEGDLQGRVHPVITNMRILGNP
jgi:hypothetical protein